MSYILLSADESTTFTQPDVQINRRKEYFQTLLNVEASTDDGILNQIEALPLKIELDSPPTLREMEITIRKRKLSKAPGLGGISAEVYMLGREKLTRKLYASILKCGQQGNITQEFKDVLIVPIYKKEGDRRNYANFRGIFLLVIAEKVMA